MASGFKKVGKSRSFEKRDFEQIFTNFPDPIFVTDTEGNILLSNSTTAYALDISLDQLMRSNVKDLVQKGYYSKSNHFEAVETKRTITDILTTKLNVTFISTSTPIIDEQGNVSLVITTARPKELIEKHAHEEDREQLNKQKREMEYLRSRVLESGVIVAESTAMRQVLFTAHALAQADSTVMLYGESGTGKEVLAQYMHRHSKRADEVFIAVNCATFPENLVESELFGYEKGSFTGARQEGKIGLIEAAHRGTLFLDEIAELPLALQAKLLRVIETNEVRRLGSTTNRKIDFRLISATHRDLKKMTEEGIFRSDLFYRLNVIPITIPPLRERPEDIVLLAKQFIEHFNQKYSVKVELDGDLIRALVAHSWPGNVRELRNEIERIVIRNMQDFSSDFLTVALLPGQAASFEFFKFLGLNGSLKEVEQKVEKLYIEHVLKACGGNITKAANELGICREVLHRKLKTYKSKEI